MSSKPHTHSESVECEWCALPFSARFVIESAAIEGQIIPASKVEQSAHMQAYLSMRALADSGADLTQADLKNWQRLIGGEQHLWRDRALDTDELGAYRQYDIGLSTPTGSKPIGATWSTIQDEMDDLWDLLWQKGRGWTGNMAWQGRTPIEKAAMIHHRFERIHPFADGNGRSGRLLALYVLRAVDAPPVLFTNWDKAQTYYPAFEKKLPDLMIEYFVTHVASW